MGRGLGQRHAARLSTSMTMAVLLCLTGAPVVQSLSSTADDYARPRARVTPDLPVAMPGMPGQDIPDRAVPWLAATGQPGVSRTEPAGRKAGQEITGPKGSRVWVPSLLTDTGIPYAASRAYHHAASAENQVDPACHIPWTLLAAIGRVESDHGQYGGAVLDASGISHPAILGVPLNGQGDVAAIPDTDNGVLDHDTVWDRAVGPMQFLPSTWRTWARDGDGNGVSNPNDINDAALAAAAYLCASGSDIAAPAQMRTAIYSYNQSAYYVALVMAFQRGYQTGVFVLPPPPPTTHPAHKHANAGHGAGHKAGHKTGHKTGPTRHHTVRHHPGTVVQAGGSLATRPSSTQTANRPSPTHASSPSGSSSSSTPSGSGSADPATASSSTSTTPSSSPSSSTSGSSSPSPSSTPSSTPSSSSSPTPSPAPTLTSVTGTLRSCGTGWCLDGTPLDLGSATVLAGPAGDDYDGDGTVESRADELDGLVGSQVTLLVVAKSSADTVYVINGMDYRYADGTFA